MKATDGRSDAAHQLPNGETAPVSAIATSSVSSYEAKRSREKLRREEMNAAIQALRETLVEVDHARNPNVHSHRNTSTSATILKSKVDSGVDLSPNASEHSASLFDSVLSISPDVLAGVSMGQRDVIKNAVEVLTRIHAENEYHKTQEAYLINRIKGASSPSLSQEVSTRPTL